MIFRTHNTRRCNYQKSFTLLEIIFVIAIIVLVTGVGIMFAARVPAGAVLTNIVAKMEALMVTAETQAALQGKQKNVIYDSEKRMFYISEPEKEEGGHEELQNAFAEGRSAYAKGESLKLAEDIKIEFPEYDEESIEYRFFPDGSASGPDMLLTLKAHKQSLHVSPLTGIVTITEIEER